MADERQLATFGVFSETDSVSRHMRGGHREQMPPRHVPLSALPKSTPRHYRALPGMAELKGYLVLLAVLIW